MNQEMHEHQGQPLNVVRRHDRAVDDDSWIRAMLHRTPFGVLATAQEGQPFINTNTFVYDEAAHAIYLHTARAGRTPATIGHNDRVCFSISEMGRLLPAEVALKFSVEYASVVVFGRAAIIEERTAAARALQMLLDKYFPHLRSGVDYRPVTDDEITLTAVYCIQIDQWSGKKKEAAADFPGACFYEYQRP
jgi:hypothetical protein